MALETMSKTNLFILGCLFFLVDSCISPQDGSTVVFDVDGGVSTPVSVFDLFSEVSVTTLEQADRIAYSVYNGPSSIACSQDRLYILDEWNRIIYVYGLDGTLLDMVNHLGRGHGEFAMASAIKAGCYEGSVDVLDPSCRIIHYSSSEGMPYLSEENYRQFFSSINDFALTDDGYYVLFSISEERPFSISKSGSSSIKQVSYRPQSWLYRYQYPNPPLFEISGKVCFFEPDNGTIYSIEPSTGSYSLLYQFDVGKYTCKTSDIPKKGKVEEYGEFIRQYSLRRVSPFLRMLACKNLVFITAVFQNDVCTLVFNTDSKDTCFIKKTKEGMKLMPGVYYDGCIYSIVESSYIEDYISYAILNEQALSDIKRAKEEEGAILIKYRLK